MDLVGVIQQYVPDNENIDYDYLKRLCSMPQAMMKPEQQSISSSYESITQSKYQLGASHASDFVGTHKIIDRLEALTRKLDQSSKEAQELSLSIPRIPERSFKGINALLIDDMAVYDNIDKIQELLSLPELVRDRVIDGEYGQALDFASMTERLHTRYPKSALVTQLVSDVQQSVDSMRDNLLRSLREASKLSSLTKAVTYLRIMNFPQLESVFIDSRWSFLEYEQWNAIPVQLKQTQPFAYLKRFAEIYREHVFATINGFRVIFQEKNQANNVETSETPLARFSRRALARLIAELKEHAPLITNSSDRTSLWLQLAFCSRSMGRVGADFWRLLDSDILSQEEWEEALQHQQDMARRASRYAPK